ncbi:hypothetical protein SUGI_0647720 [Cryptomeria japonica]|uniref:pterocarpan synthase 1 n=1 Tax=Cryptomeria japonica TaxID=3369 RepID=UPI002414BAE0|nr:pterocarpan synthase 1 [Cryptomeria japonica]GLJ32173.1 hypothetical protein SUGI_0647720 [Cryptomeria japonica]
MATKASLFLFFVMPILLLVIFSSTPVWEVLNRCLNLGEEKMVFYVQEAANGANATVSIAGGKNSASSSVSTFGTIFVIDNPITEGLANTTKILGRLQGVEANSALNGTNFHLGASLLFENGGTLEIQGIIKTQVAQRELSVVGGTGKFRYAQGFVSVEIVASDRINLTFKFTVTIRSHLPIFKQLFGGL